MQFPNEANRVLLKISPLINFKHKNVPQRQTVTCKRLQLDYVETFHFPKPEVVCFFISGALKHFNPHHLCESMYEIRMRGKRESQGS